jgi:dienelactone hydrolase
MIKTNFELDGIKKVKREMHITKIIQRVIFVLFLPILLLTYSGCAPIDAEYSSSGPYAVTNAKVPGFTIFYPKQMNGRHPIITWGNGTGAPTNAYEDFLGHLATWGFVVIASDSSNTGTGMEMIDGINYMLKENERYFSPFYGQLDTENIGSIGHSQGGAGSINTAVDDRVKCAVPIAPAQGEISLVNCPIFLIAGYQDTLVPYYWVQFTSYALANAPTIFGILQNVQHGPFAENYIRAKGYITAWFLYYLKGNKYAGRAFVDECEICHNPDWTVYRKNF